MLQKGIEIPVKFLVNLINMKEMLTNAQKTLIWKRTSKWKGIVLKPTKRQIHGGFLGTLAAIGIPMAIELASKIFGSGAGQGLQTPRKAGGKGAGQGLQTPRKAGTGVGQGLQVSQKPFLWQPPPSMVHGRGRDAERREKDFREADFCWGTTAHSTTSPSWEQFFKAKPGALCAKGEAKMERYSLSNFDLLKWVVDFLKIKNSKESFPEIQKIICIKQEVA